MVVLIVCHWCAEEILVPIVAARGYCSWACQDADPTGGRTARPGYCQPPTARVLDVLTAVRPRS